MNSQRRESDMTKVFSCRSRLKNQGGAVIVIIAVLTTVLIGFAALAIDIGYLMVTKNELQNVADATALAACRKLGTIYQGMTYEEQQSYVCDPETIKSVAREVGLKNKAATKWIAINDEDIVIGQWPPSPPASPFVNDLNKPNAVRVKARRDDKANGFIPTFFAGVFDSYLMSAEATATAALTGQSTSDPGELELPVGISREWFDSRPGEACGDHIKFSPTTDPDACAGWTTFTEGANTNNLKGILDGEVTSPTTTAGETEFEFTGGDATSAFSNLLLLFKHKGYDVYETDANGNTCSSPEPCWIRDSQGEPVNLANDPAAVYYDANGNPGVHPEPLYELDGAGNETTTRLNYPPELDATPHDPLMPRNKHTWETTVVVYSNQDGTADCSNPNMVKTVVGYARIRLTDVVDAPNRLVVGELVCDYVDNADSRGGGGEAFGLMGSIPGLVQ